jgi:hypothetical protein
MNAELFREAIDKFLKCQYLHPVLASARRLIKLD